RGARPVGHPDRGGADRGGKGGVLSARFRFRHVEVVRFRDLDALGHVNHAVYLTYFESARIAYWLHATKRTGLGALDMILARAEIDFRAPPGHRASLRMPVGA